MTAAAGIAAPAGLPPMDGRVTHGTELSTMTWFRVGGPAETLFRPASQAALAAFLAACDPAVPVMVLGVGSNLLVRDGGVPGVVIRLARGFAEVVVEGDLIHAGAGALDSVVARTAADAGLAGLEFLSGIPGTVGGGLRMNAGAYGSEFADVLVAARAVDRSGRVHDVGPGDLGFGYRHCSAPADWIFTHAVLRGRPADGAAVHARMAEIANAREATQPVRLRTGGSTFRNPPEGRAWELIDRSGCRGLVHGRAQVSPLHCNFLINLGDATATEIEELGELVRDRVATAQGVVLEWEIARVGRPAAAAQAGGGMR